MVSRGVDGEPYFEATDKTGKKYLYGQTSATRVANPSDASKIFRWCLDRVEDVHDNYMTITYAGSQSTAYLSRTDYTGNVCESLATTNSVVFSLKIKLMTKPHTKLIFPSRWTRD